MRASWFVCAFLLTLSTFPAVAADSTPALPVLKKDMILWYRRPATRWNEGMLMGNGLMGINVFGGTKQERIALNESSFWSGSPHDYNNPDAIKYFSKIRELIDAQKFREAEKMVTAHFWGIPASQQCFEPIGDLLLSFDSADAILEYRRELDMETGVAKITYRDGDALITREVFVSYPDRVMVLRITSDKPGRVSLRSQFKSYFPIKVSATPGKLVMDGQWKGPIKGDWIGPATGPGIRFEAALVALPEGGKAETSDNSIQIKDANAITLVLNVSTSYVNYQDISADPAARCEKVLTGVAGKDYATLRARHVADFAGIMGRLHLAIGDEAANQKPTDERLQAVSAGRRGSPDAKRAPQENRADQPQPAPAADANLEALCFQFGRYALLASSRAGGQPANLQGIWNENPAPPWGSKYTININTQMNYWPAEVCNLSECHQPLFDMIEDASINGRKTAKMHYGVNGWVAHHNLDLWRGTAPVDAVQFGMWPVGGAWLCQHIWEHYAFTGDRQFLKEHYPIMKGSARFLLELMVEEPKHHWLVTPFSMSPDGNSVKTAKAVTVSQRAFFSAKLVSTAQLETGAATR